MRIPQRSNAAKRDPLEGGIFLGRECIQQSPIGCIVHFTKTIVREPFGIVRYVGIVAFFSVVEKRRERKVFLVERCVQTNLKRFRASSRRSSGVAAGGFTRSAF